MNSAQTRLSFFNPLLRLRIFGPLLLALLLAFVLLLSIVRTCRAQESQDILPLSQVKPGMTGYAYTIFAGDQIEKFDLQVIGVMPNFLGPKQSIILVVLKGPKVEHTGVVAGMSGSPVYLEGKLAGALSLKLGIFTKEPLAGVTPSRLIDSSTSRAVSDRWMCTPMPLVRLRAATSAIISGGQV